MTDWWLTDNRQKTNGILWPRLYVHKNTKGTDQLKRTLKDFRENIDFNRCPLDIMHSTKLKQLYLAKFTKLRRVVSMSWITEQKQTEVNKKTTKYLWNHYTLLWMEECYYSFWMGWKNKVLKFLFLFLLIIFALDNVLILNEEKLLVDHF